MQLEIHVGILLPSYHNNTNITQKKQNTPRGNAVLSVGGGGVQSKTI